VGLVVGRPSAASRSIPTALPSFRIRRAVEKSTGALRDVIQHPDDHHH